MPTYFRVVIELARGCPSTGWCMCLGGAQRPAGRLHVLRAGANGVLRPRRSFRVRLLRVPGRGRPAQGRRLRPRRHVALLVGDPVLDPLHGPDAAAPRRHHRPGTHVRHSRRQVRAPERLGRRARPHRQRVTQRAHRQRLDPRAPHDPRDHGRPPRRGRHRRLAAARQPDVRRAQPRVLPRRAGGDHGRRRVRRAGRVRARPRQAVQVEGILFRTGGSGSARNGQRMQRYWRDMSTYWSHNTPAQRDLLLLRLGRMRLGLPLDRPGMLPSRETGAS